MSPWNWRNAWEIFLQRDNREEILAWISNRGPRISVPRFPGDRSREYQAFRARILSPNRRRMLVIYNIKNGHGRSLRYFESHGSSFLRVLSFCIYEAGGNDTSGQNSVDYLEPRVPRRPFPSCNPDFFFSSFPFMIFLSRLSVCIIYSLFRLTLLIILIRHHSVSFVF